jgi:hypothetical protein
MYSEPLLLVVSIFALWAVSRIEAQDLFANLGVAGPPIEVVHLYHGQWPTGEFCGVRQMP